MADKVRGRKTFWGQAMPEYGTIIAFMAIVLWVVFQIFGQTVSNFLSNFANTMTTLAGG